MSTRGQADGNRPMVTLEPQAHGGALARGGTRSADSDARKTEYLDTLRELGVVRRALEVTGVQRSTLYEWRDSDPVFAEELRLVMDDIKDHHVSQLVRLGNGEGMPAVTANIARLRNLDPAGWSPERQAQVQVNVTVQAAAVHAALDERGVARTLRAVPELPALPAPEPEADPDAGVSFP